MKGERGLLWAGEYLVRVAARRLPAETRDERYSEWAAELPVILGDPEVRPGMRRAVRMLGYAVGAIRGATLGHPLTRRAKLGRAAAVLVIVLGAPVAATPLGGGQENSAGYWLQSLVFAVVSMAVFGVLGWKFRKKFLGFLVLAQLGPVLFDAASLLLVETRHGGWSPGWLHAVEAGGMTAEVILGAAGVLCGVDLFRRWRRRSGRPCDGGAARN